MSDLTNNTSGYFDYAASNPLWPEAALAMTEAMAIVGNPSATHSFGQKARRLLDESRDRAAGLFGVESRNIIFTSGATEANNLAIMGVLRPILDKQSIKKPKVLTSLLEHSSVNGPLQRLADSNQISLEYLPLLSDARVDLKKATPLIDKSTVLVCLTVANNILGSIQPIAEMGNLISAQQETRKEEGSELPLIFFSDAVQAAVWLPLRPKDWNLDVMVISGHKAGGPKGVGLFWVREGLEITPIIFGGGQEKDLRSGTENLPAITGMVTALEKSAEIRKTEVKRCQELRQRLIVGLAKIKPNTRVLGALEADFLPGTAYVHLPKVEGDILAIKLDAAGFAVSAGSACDAGHRRSPEVLETLYGGEVAKWSGVRISFGRFTDESDIDRLVSAFFLL